MFVQAVLTAHHNNQSKVGMKRTIMIFALTMGIVSANAQLKKEVKQLGAQLDNEKQKSNVLNEQIYRNMFGDPGHGMMMDGRYNKYMDLDAMDLPYWLRKKFRIPL